MLYDLESNVIIVMLLALSAAYTYILVAPNQPRLPSRPRNFVIRPDSRASFEAFVNETRGWGVGSAGGGTIADDFRRFSQGANKWSGAGQVDDFFFNPQSQGYKHATDGAAPIVPSEHFLCREGWLAIRSEMNYKYLWMHTGDSMWMGATATMDTPLHRKSFKVVAVEENCKSGWVLLQEGDSKGFLTMVAPSKNGDFVADEWVVKIGTENLEEARADNRTHFLVEEDGFLLNRGAMAFVNVMPESEYAVRGHSSGWDRSKPAGREYGAMMHFQFVNASDVQAAIAKERAEIKEALEQDKQLIAQIAKFPTNSREKRVVSFGLYGSKPKYTVGAIRNAELAATYFPGWTCRFYVTSDVPEEVVMHLRSLHAEVFSIPAGMGYISGMFWRFMVAADPSVDRYIIRDTDSRLNARDRFAVEEWIESKYPVHIMRDHVNHCIVMNGGMWGGIKDAISSMEEKIKAWTSRDEYMADLHFLEEKIWPDVMKSQIAHDSYCCDRFPNARPFVTKRPITYQHVGQVFDEFENPRLMDIDGFIRGVPVPGSCRKRADWIYG